MREKAWVPLLILVMGLALRGTVYLQNRSLFIDEANLARNIVERDWGGFFRPLDYHQYAPPLFSALAKAVTSIGGDNEYALRLPALAAGFATLVLLMLLLKKLVPVAPVRWYLLLLFAFSTLAIRYGTECKPYALDGALTLGALCWGLRLKNHPLNARTAAAGALAGAVAIWASMPLVFSLAALGLALSIRAWRGQREQLRYLLPMGLVWILSFALYYVRLLHNDATSPYLQNYHRPYFIDLLPTDRTQLLHSYKLLVSLFRSATDKSSVSIAWSALTLLLGGVCLLGRRRYELVLLAGPILLCLLASHLQQYSLIPRLTLFMVPLIILLMGAGISELWRLLRRPVARLLLLVPMLLGLVNARGYVYFTRPLQLEDSRGVLFELAARREGPAPIYVEQDGVPAFVFYNSLHDKALHLPNVHLAAEGQDLTALFDQVGRPAAGTGFWVYFAHTFPTERVESELASASSFATLQERIVSVEASAYRFEVH